MWSSVLTAFPVYTDSFEGWLDFMYLDVEGYVTTGRGDLIDPVSTALRLPWVDEVSGQSCDVATIEAAWQKVKADTALERAGGGAFKSLTTLRLSKQAVDDLSFGRLAEMESILKTRFPSWDSLPADAQLGVISISWACGPDFKFPHFEAALKAGNFATYIDGPLDDEGNPTRTLAPGCCASECPISTKGNPGVKPRNAADVKLFESAQRVVDGGLDPTVLYGWSAS